MSYMTDKWNAGEVKTQDGALRLVDGRRRVSSAYGRCYARA